MDIRAVERVRSVEQVGMRRGPADVAPALGVAGASIEEDSYRGSEHGQERGMDEQPEDDVQERSQTPSEPDEMKSVKMLA